MLLLQGHGYWFHGLLGTIGNYHWGTVSRYRTAMLVSTVYSKVLHCTAVSI